MLTSHLLPNPFSAGNPLEPATDNKIKYLWNESVKIWITQQLFINLLYLQIVLCSFSIFRILLKCRFIHFCQEKIYERVNSRFLTLFRWSKLSPTWGIMESDIGWYSSFPSLYSSRPPADSSAVGLDWFSLEQRWYSNSLHGSWTRLTREENKTGCD